MALEPRFVRQTADRQPDEPWKDDVIVAAAYTHFTELPVIDICAALVYDGRDITTLGADRGGEEAGEAGGHPGRPPRKPPRCERPGTGTPAPSSVRRPNASEAKDSARTSTLAQAAASTELPFDYFCEFLRQTWDEVRHSRMGFERLQALGVDPYQVAIPLGHYASGATSTCATGSPR